MHHFVYPDGDAPPRLGRRRHLVEDVVHAPQVILGVAEDKCEAGAVGPVDRFEHARYSCEARWETLVLRVFQALLAPGHLGIESLGRSALELRDAHPHGTPPFWSVARPYKPIEAR